MTTRLHTLTRAGKRPAPRVGRGGRRGKTSGRGHKGQRARAGGTPRPQLRDVIKKIPKQRGHGKNRARTVYTDRPRPMPVSLSAIEKAYTAGETVSPKTLVEKGLIQARKDERPFVKILANGELTTKVTVEECLVSDNAREQITKAGGTIQEKA